MGRSLASLVRASGELGILAARELGSETDGPSETEREKEAR